jgi:hypothetical protein
MRGEEGRGREPVRPERAPCVESEPPEPEDARAEDHHRDVVRREVPPRVAPALPDEESRREGGRAGADVHHGAACEVKGPDPGGPEEPAAPDPVRERRVDQERPEGHERHVPSEADPLGERARDQRRRDHGEHQLERRERRVRHGGRERVRHLPDPAEPEVREAADHASHIGAERERVAGQQPHHGDDRDRGDRLHHRAEHVLRPDEASVEQRQPRRHEQDEGRRPQNPGGVTGVDHALCPHPEPPSLADGSFMGHRRL